MIKNKPVSEKITYYGGQAVIEGVMMRGKKSYAICVRNKDNDIDTVKKDITGKPNKFLKLPIVRGVVMFVESLVLGSKLIYQSAEMSGLDDFEEEKPSKIDIFLERIFKDKLFDVIIGLGAAIAIVLSVALFMLLPAFITSLIGPLFGSNPYALSFFEGIFRICIFILYVALVSRAKDVRRVFEYHGAEHKTINCYENGEALTVENVKKHSRLHKRCGTSFLIIVMIVSMVFFFFVKTNSVWMRVLTRLLFVPLMAGVSYEIIKWAGKSDSKFVKLISYPGLMLQKLTTREPDDGEIEVAVKALKEVLIDDGKLEPQA